MGLCIAIYTVFLNGDSACSAIHHDDVLGISNVRNDSEEMSYIEGWKVWTANQV